jgi:Xaa-Pro aminopeptidase
MSAPPREELEARTARARAAMADRGIDALVVTDPVNYYYYSGHRAPAHVGRPSLLVLPLEGSPVLITMWVQDFFCGLDGVPFPSWIEDRRFYPEVPFDTTQPADWGVAAVLRERGLKAGTIGIELGVWTRLAIPVADYTRLTDELPRARFVDSGPVTWACRLVKSPWELETMRRACQITGRAWQRLFAELRPGMTGREICKRVALYHEEEGAALLFSGFARGATGPGGAFQRGDVLYLDGGCVFDGYHSDFTRRAVFGPPNERQREEHLRALEAQRAMLERVRPGASMAELFAAANEELARAGLADRNYADHPAKRLGHGIGLEQGEPPSINGIDETVLAEGMTLTVEPKFMSDDGLVNPDDVVVVTADGHELLSTLPSPELHVVG